MRRVLTSTVKLTLGPGTDRLRVRAALPRARGRGLRNVQMVLGDDALLPAARRLRGHRRGQRGRRLLFL